MSRFFATLLVLVCAAMSVYTVDANGSAALYRSSTCAPPSAGYMTGLDTNNKCFQIDGFVNFKSGSIRCVADGSGGFNHVSTLYTDNSCSLTVAMGSGNGNGISCSQLSTTGGQFAAAVQINCDSASNDAASASASVLVTGAIIAVGATGALLFA